MNIRAHHLLCMKYFKGKGYSKEFVSNFYKVIKKLKDNSIIKVINHPDVICGSCPHNANSKCTKKGPDFEKEVEKKDNIVIKHLELNPNQEIKAKDAGKLVILKLSKIKEICIDCEWQKYCN